MFKEGDIVPNFSIKTEKNNFELYNVNKKFIVVFFFPKAMTSGCTKEAVEFSNLIEEFEALNTMVIGISKDNIMQQIKFREKNDLNLILGSDEDGKICEMFSVWVEKSMYGKKYMGIQRSTFIINENHEILKCWPKVKVNNHASEVLESISNL